MRVRTIVLATAAALLTSLWAVPVQADSIVLAVAEAPVAITSARPTTTVKVTVQSPPLLPYRGTWELVGSDGSTQVSRSVGGNLDANSSLEVVIDGLGLPDASYTFGGRIDVSHPTEGTLFATILRQTLIVDQNGPQIEEVATTHSTIYPRVLTERYPGTTQIDFQGTGMSSSDVVEVRNGAGALLPTFLGYYLASTSGWRVDWDGRSGSSRALVPPGKYSVSLRDRYGNPASRSVSITVSTLHRVRKVFKTTISATASLEDSLVGRCSQLRKPSLRKWKGSIGLYANTKCQKQSYKASAVSTLHAVRLPTAFDYRTLKIEVYGGAAKSRSSSRAYLRTLTTKGRWVGENRLSKKLRTHTGFVQNNGAANFVYSDRYVAWGMVAAYKDRYDVKSFTITSAYDVLAN